MLRMTRATQQERRGNLELEEDIPLAARTPGRS